MTLRAHALIVAGLLITLHAQAADDAVLTAASAALSGGQALEAAALLAGHSGLAAPGAPRLLLARAQLASGRAQRALATLAINSADFSGSLAQWPKPWQGAVAQLAAQCWSAPGEQSAVLTAAHAALALGGAQVERDRCLALIADAAQALGHPAEAIEAERALWQRWPGSPYRPAAGLALAAALADGAGADSVTADPSGAREILTALRMNESTPRPVRLAAGERLCALLLPTRPGDCLVVAEKDLRRLRSAEGKPSVAPNLGRLPLFRALALCALSPSEGAAALATLPPELANDPAARAALAINNVAPANVALIIQRAQAAAELGARDTAEALLRPLAATTPAALIALSELNDVDPLPLLDLPAAADVATQRALIPALLRVGATARAWTMVNALPVTASSATARAYWTWRLAPDANARAQAQATLLAAPDDSLEVGLAAAEHAQTLEKTGADATAAWTRAAHALPVGHPWRAEAAWRAGRAAAAAGDAKAARALIESEAWRTDDDAALRCRFLLVQVLERLGERDAALRAAQSLAHAGTPEQQVRVQHVIEHLQDPPQ